MMMSLVAPAPARFHMKASTSVRPQQRAALQVVAAEKKSQASLAEVSSYQRSAKDSGSTEVQIALLSSRVENLTAHMQTNRKDYDTQRGLLKVLGQRKRLLEYLKQKDEAKFNEIVASLGIRFRSSSA